MKMFRRAFMGSRGDSVRTMLWALIAVIFGFACGVLVARLLTVDHRGILAIILTASSLVSLISGLGVTTAFRSLYFIEARATLGAYKRFSLNATLIVILLVAIGLPALRGLIWSSDAPPSTLLFAMVCLTAVTFLSIQTLDALNGVGMTSHSAALNVVGSAGTLIVLLLGFLTRASLLTVVFAYSFGFLIRTLIGVIWLRRLETPPDPDPGSAPFLVRRGVGFLGMLLGQALTFRGDQFVLGLFTSSGQVGLYAIAAAPASITMVIAGSIGQVAMRNSAQRRLSLLGFRRATGVSFALTLVITSIIAAAAPILVPFIYGEPYLASVPTLRILMLGQLLLAPYSVASRVIAGLGMTRFTTFIGLTGAATLIILFWFLVPVYGALGGAIGAAITYAVMSILSCLVATHALSAISR